MGDSMSAYDLAYSMTQEAQHVAVSTRRCLETLAGEVILRPDRIIAKYTV